MQLPLPEALRLAKHPTSPTTGKSGPEPTIGQRCLLHATDSFRRPQGQHKGKEGSWAGLFPPPSGSKKLTSILDHGPLWPPHICKSDSEVPVGKEGPEMLLRPEDTHTLSKPKVQTADVLPINPHVKQSKHSPQNVLYELRDRGQANWIQKHRKRSMHCDPAGFITGMQGWFST